MVQEKISKSEAKRLKAFGKLIEPRKDEKKRKKTTSVSDMLGTTSLYLWSFSFSTPTVDAFLFFSFSLNIDPEKTLRSFEK